MHSRTVIYQVTEKKAFSNDLDLYGSESSLFSLNSNNFIQTPIDIIVIRTMLVIIT